MKTVLIFAHEFRPFHRQISTIGAQRPAEFAQYLPDHGWRAIVLCADNTRRRTIKPSELLAAVNEAEKLFHSTKPNENLVIPLPSLLHDGLIDRLWNSTITFEKNGAIKSKSGIYSLLRKPFTIAKMFTGDYSQSWQPVAKAVTEMLLKTVKVDISIAEHSPDASLYLSKWLHAKYNIPWVVDFRDPVLEPYNGILRHVYRNYLKHVLKTCSGTINVNEYLSEIDQADFDKPSFTITNGFSKADFENKQYTRDEFFKVSYFGSINGGFQDIEIFMKGWVDFVKNLSTPDREKVKFIYRGSSFNHVSNIASALDISAETDSLPNIDRVAALDLMSSSELLLLLSVAHYYNVDTYFTKGLYPGKAFEYFGAQRPIISVPGDNALLDTLIAETNTGSTLKTVKEIAFFLSEAYMQWSKNQNINYQPQKELVDMFTRDKLTLKLSVILNTYS